MPAAISSLPEGLPAEAVEEHAFVQQLAGIVFALLYGAALVLLRPSFPDGITQRAGWVGDRPASVSIAAHLLASAASPSCG